MTDLLSLSGLIPVHKPTGMTSKDVSRHLVKRFGKLKIGHVGTLDPDAEGVLPVLIGSATKLQDYLLELPKVYRFIAKFGEATTTLDASGPVIATTPIGHVSLEGLRSAMQARVGSQIQIPPLYSAVKLAGRELYKYAQKGSDLDATEREKLARQVMIYAAEALSYESPYFEGRIRCSKGTYVRTFAEDLARDLGCAAHLTRLMREESSGICLEACKDLQDILAHELQDSLIPLHSVSIGLPVWKVDDTLLVRRIQNGQHVKLPQAILGDVLTNAALTDRQKIHNVSLWNEAGQHVGVCEFKVDQQHVFVHLKRGFL